MTPPAGLRIEAIGPLPEIEPGDDLAALIVQAGGPLEEGDVLCVAQKLVSKAEGRIVDLADVEPTDRAHELAGARTPEHTQVILDETAELVRAGHGVLISRTHHGFVCANAGVDLSNAREGQAILLPVDPDASARQLRAALARHGRAPAVVICDSFGRPFRIGQVDVAIGAAGIEPILPPEGNVDRLGRALQATEPALPDELAAAAGLVRTKHGGEGVVRISGLTRGTTIEDGPGVAALRRSRDEDLFA